MVGSLGWWMKQVLPPLLILPLAIMPPDLPMAILWIIGLLACVVSVINLIRMLIRSRRLGRSVFWPSVRPILTIFFMLLAFISIQVSRAQATDFGRNAAQDIQRRCHAEKACPASISGWDPRRDAFASETYSGALAKYRVLYHVSSDRRQFNILVRYDLGSGLVFTGGVNEELRELKKGN